MTDATLPFPSLAAQGLNLQAVFDLRQLPAEVSDSLALDMASVEASLAGPKRPQDRVSLPNVAQAFSDFLGESKVHVLSAYVWSLSNPQTPVK